VASGLAAAPAAGGLGVGAAEAEQAEEAAYRRFLADYPVLPAAGLVVVIAAFNEAANLPVVLAEMPARVLGLPVVSVVVDDGSTDETGAAARAGAALTASLPVNCGQGVALRLGYRLAREIGAAYIATLDADGQYDPAELPDVLAPIISGQADFVTGSRRLGRAESPTLTRRAGTRFFAWLVSALAGQKITDTSNGLRAMRAQVTERVTLAQPQYQASELLIGALAAGYRVHEVPTVIHRRLSGHSKKGPNLRYGYHYARVVLSTWWRERRR
jgi:glycosyltransferase involved in cell wall biosynthesis